MSATDDQTTLTTDTAGTSVYLFPRCSLTMNYPGNEDYRAALPIGLLVEPNSC